MKILFMCVANSARSQMAEALARSMAPPGVEIFSAGSAPTNVRPEAVAVMEELDLDLSAHRSKGIDDLPVEEMGLLVTLCADEVCPIVPGLKREHWPFPDPAMSSNIPWEERLASFRSVRDQIRVRLELFFS